MKKHLDKILMATAGVALSATAITGGIFAFYHPNTVGPKQRNRDNTITGLNDHNMTFYNQSLIGIYKSGSAKVDLLVQAIAPKDPKKHAPTLVAGTEIILDAANQSFTLPLVDGNYHVEVISGASNVVLNWELNVNADNQISYSKDLSSHIKSTSGLITDGVKYISTSPTTYKIYSEILTSYSNVDDDALLANINSQAHTLGLAPFSKKSATTVERKSFKDICEQGFDASNVSGLIKGQLKALAKKKTSLVIERAVRFTNGTQSFTIVQSNTGVDAGVGRNYSEAVSGSPFKVLGVTVDPVSWALKYAHRLTQKLGIRFKYSVAFDKDSLNANNTLNTKSLEVQKILHTLLGTQ